MPFIRYTRDKRGFESTLVMHAYREADGGQRTRVLYVFRTPGNVRVGRQPLDEEVVEALEHTHPDLAFDWEALLREPAEPRFVGPKKGRRSAAGKKRRSKPSSAGPEASAPEIVIDDESALGRALGATEAAGVRRRYRELLDRILRRARTPEDRDRLTERAQRLNPDDWADETVVKATLASAEAEWAEIFEELPKRRRGRRGGRRRGAARAAEPEAENSAPAGEAEPAEVPAEPSGIMAEEGPDDAVQDDE